MNARAFGVYLRESRTQKKLSIRQLERLSGVSNAYIPQIGTGSRGIPSPEVLRKIADPLGISYEELLEKAGYVDSPPSDSTDLEDIFRNTTVTFKGRELNDHQKHSMLSFVKTLMKCRRRIHNGFPSIIFFSIPAYASKSCGYCLALALNNANYPNGPLLHNNDERFTM